MLSASRPESHTNHIVERKEAMAMTQKKRSILGEVIPVFTSHPIINEGTLTNIYQKLFNRPLGMKSYGYKKLADFYSQVHVFDRVGDKYIQISRAKLLDFLLKPLIVSGALDVPINIESRFVGVNGFSPKILCDFCDVPTLMSLVHEIQPQVLGPPHTPILPLLPPPLPLQARPQPLQQPMVAPPTPPRCAASPLIPPPTNLLIPPGLPPSETIKQPSFPNSGIHPKDESFLPALHGHPRLDLPTATPSLPPRPVLKQHEKRAVMIEKVNAYTREFIICFSSQGKHLPVQIVTDEVNELTRNRIHRSELKNIKAWDNFDKLYKRLDAFIRTFCWNCPFTSLYELQRTILEFEKVSSFEELRMGPILKHPLLQDLFKIPDDLTSVPEITTYDILDAVNAFVNKYRKGDNIWDKLEEFMAFFAKRLSYQSPQHLCVRVSSYRMALSVSVCY